MSRRSTIALLATALVVFSGTAWGQGSPELVAARDSMASAPAGGFDENVVLFEVDGQNLVGTLAMPTTEAPPPVALLLPGFSGLRDELPVTDTDEGVYQRTARMLAERGIASLRIDYRGSGDSDGAWEDTTFTSQITDAMAAVDLLAGYASVDSDRIGVVGWSQGGLVGAATAARHPSVASTVLWAPVAVASSTFTHLFGPETMIEGLAAGDTVVTATLPWEATTDLRGWFFEDMFVVDPVAEIAGYDGPLLVIVGSRDDTVFPQPQSGELFTRYHDGPEELLLLDTDHVWDAFSGPETVDQMALWTAAWLSMTMP